MKKLIFIATIASSGCATASAEDVSGTWVNERGSAVTFTVKEGLLSGYYNTQLGNPDSKSKFPLTGFIEGDQVTFTVNFKGYDSLTSWTGQISQDDQGPFIRTLWHLTRDVPDDQENEDMWSSIVAGSANFRPAKIELKENP